MFSTSQFSYGSLYERFITFKANKVMLTTEYIGTGKSTKQQNVNLLENFKKDGEMVKTYSGNVTNTSRKRLQHCIDLFAQCCKTQWVHCPNRKKRIKHKFAFLTLTISYNERRIDGKEAYEILLEPFIQWLKRSKKVNTYFWKAELQQPIDINGNAKLSGGQLHYHIFFPNWIEKSQIRNKWNELQKKAGLLDNYYKIHQHYNAPSTRIEKPYVKSNIADYISKEICKGIVSDADLKNAIYEREIAHNNHEDTKALDERINDLKRRKMNNDSIGGKVWGCSDNLTRKTDKFGKKENQFFKTEFTPEIEEQLAEVCFNFCKQKGFYLNCWRKQELDIDILTLPMDYIPELLKAKKYELNNNYELVETDYTKTYDNFLKNRVGKVSYHQSKREVPLDIQLKAGDFSFMYMDS